MVMCAVWSFLIILVDLKPLLHTLLPLTYLLTCPKYTNLHCIPNPSKHPKSTFPDSPYYVYACDEQHLLLLCCKSSSAGDCKKMKKKETPFPFGGTVCGPEFGCGDREYYYVCVLIVVVGGLAKVSCHGLNFSTYINNPPKAVETGDPKNLKRM